MLSFFPDSESHFQEIFRRSYFPDVIDTSWFSILQQNRTVWKIKSVFAGGQKLRFVENPESPFLSAKIAENLWKDVRLLWEWFINRGYCGEHLGGGAHLTNDNVLGVWNKLNVIHKSLRVFLPEANSILALTKCCKWLSCLNWSRKAVEPLPSSFQPKLNNAMIQ